MKKKWTAYKAWVACFDVLGFKSLIDNDGGSLSIAVLKSKIDDIVKELNGLIEEFSENVEYLFYADTFVIYSKSEKINDYPVFISVAKRFYHKCIYKKLPMSGAISFGEIEVGYDKRILIGKAFLESHEYCDGQNWLGMILAPSAALTLKEHGIEPVRHGFINYEVPMRKSINKVDDVELRYAFCFNNGSSNFKCPLLQPLNEMMATAKRDNMNKRDVHIIVDKYKNTIKFMEKYYKVHSNIKT